MESSKTVHKLLAVLGPSLASGALLCLAGCGDSARTVATYHPPVIQAVTVPQPSPAAKPQSSTPAKAAPKIGVLPLQPTRGNITFLALTSPDAVNRLAEQVRTLFAAGEQEAKAGHNDAARQDYDRALDLLLAGGFNLSKEPTLSELFNQLMSSVSSVQTTTQQAQSNEPPEAQAGQQSQPSPLDQISAITALSGEEIPAEPGDAGLKTNAERELQAVPHDLPLTLTDPVLSFLNFFKTARGRAIVENGLRRAGRYREMIRRVLAEEGMPSDLIYLAQAESAFEPQALSRAGARGLWPSNARLRSLA